MNKKLLSSLGLLLILVSLFSVALVFPMTARADGGTPPPPTPAKTPTPNPGGGGGSSITQIFENLIFPSETIGASLTKALTTPAHDFYDQIVSEEGTWATVIGNIVTAPHAGTYTKIAYSSIFIAAALAVPLFLLRLALYQWNKLTGEQDSLALVLGDWVSAGFLALICGPFLDLIVRLGWWMAGAVMGESTTLASLLITNIKVENVITGGANLMSNSMMLALFVVVLCIALLLAVAGLLMAFAIAQAILFALATLGPVAFVGGVIPQLRWLRGMWLKAVVIIALLPLIAGGIFKAFTEVGSMFFFSGLLSNIIRLMWLLGMVGILFTVVGMLGKVTVGATIDAFNGMVAAVKGVVDVAATAGLAVATGGAGLAAGGGLKAAMSGAGAVAKTGEGLGGAMGELGKASGLRGLATGFRALGLNNSAGLAQGSAGVHEVNARKLELQDRMARLGKQDDRHAALEEARRSSVDRSLGFELDASKKDDLLRSYQGTETSFRRDFEELSVPLRDNSNGPVSPGIWAGSHPVEAGALAREWHSIKDSANGGEWPSKDKNEVFEQARTNAGLDPSLFGW